MQKASILEFLELPYSATDDDIIRRAREKKQFFLQLKENAPNAVLKTLHTRNIEKVTEILAALGINESASPVAIKPSFASPIASSQRPSTNFSDTNQAVAWLVRHTEMMQTKSFPLYIGQNAVGRERQGIPTIILDNDPYVSRQHAIVEVIMGAKIQVYITDGILGKPSKNGIYLNCNEKRIEKTTTVKHNDTIQIGNTKLVLKLPDNHTPISAIEKEVDESEYVKTVFINIL